MTQGMILGTQVTRVPDFPEEEEEVGKVLTTRVALGASHHSLLTEGTRRRVGTKLLWGRLGTQDQGGHRDHRMSGVTRKGVLGGGRVIGTTWTGGVEEGEGEVGIAREAKGADLAGIIMRAIKRGARGGDTHRIAK